MIFGTTRFGIECHVRDTASRFYIGDLWLWADGQRVGDEVSSVDLPLILAALSGPLFIGDRRHDEYFESLTKDQVADFFRKLVFGEEPVPDGAKLVANMFRRYLLISAPDLEGFDSVFLLLLGAAGGRDRLIWRYNDSSVAYESYLDPNEYDKVVLSCLDWVEQQTGYRSPQRTWLGLEQARKQELRRLVVQQHPELAQDDRWESLDQTAIKELGQ